MGKGERDPSQGKTHKSRDRRPLWRALWLGTVLTVVIAWLFYDSLWAGILWPAVTFVTYRVAARNEARIRRERFLDDYKELLQVLAASLQTGYSVENAFAAAERDMQGVLSEDSVMREALAAINRQIRMHVPAEQALSSAAASIGSEEMLDFADMFTWARRLGGDYSATIRRMAEKTGASVAQKQELMALMADKELERRIMSVMPAGMLAYIRLTSADYMSVLYHSTAGVIIMSICLVVYASLVAAAMRIMQIPL